MAARVVAAVEERLVIVLATAEVALDQQPLVTFRARATTPRHLVADCRQTTLDG
jgi:hypothetical protein